MRYYSALRPITIGVLSSETMKKVVLIHNYDNRQYEPAIDRNVWGYIETDIELSAIEIEQSELTPEYCALTEKEKRLKAAYILAENGYTKKEAYIEAMAIPIDEIDAIIEP